MSLSYFVVDIFADRAFDGAPMTVIVDDQQLSDFQMVTIAQENPLTQTVFVQTSQSMQKKAKVFSLQGEVPLTTHCVMAAAQVLANECNNQIPNDGKIRFADSEGVEFETHVLMQNGESLVTIAQTVRSIENRAIPTIKQIADVLHLIPADIGFEKFEPMIVDAQGPYLIVPIKSYNAVRAARVNQDLWIQSSLTSSLVKGVFLFSNNTDSNTADFHSRIVSPEFSNNFDPPTGSVIPSFAAYLCHFDTVQEGTHSFEVQRGATNARQSHIHVEMDNKKQSELNVRIAGGAVTAIRGKIMIPR
ncbi:MAG: PhzF family phenazine biosynthesis protein [Saccharospirillaceae bacterium]|nr:PhzF family phenazine biosynthesis isomerase [Pseudomonadales bacterium]NRB79328.1 PhzF family phenazine biosynthesis protein [Saccharospirillaceae bacterium]